jgi:hypothetical protein
MNRNFGWLLVGAFLLIGCLSGKNEQRAAAATADDKAAPSTSAGLADTASFLERCASPGVFKCASFDQDSDFLQSGGPPHQTVYPNSKGSFANLTKDCAVAVNGCSLRFTVPASPEAGANMSGKYEYDFAKDGKEFGQNSTFYVQVRIRFDRPLLANKYGGEGWKFVLIYGGKSSCSNVGLINQNTWYYGFPTMAHECSPGVFTFSGKTQYVEQGDYNCAYGKYNPKDCAYFKPDQWMTFYWKVHLGAWGQPDSSVDAWVSYENAPLKKWISQPKFTFKYQDGPSDVFDKVALTPYTTNRSEAAAADGHMWFDELIASSQPIPAPYGPTP